MADQTGDSPPPPKIIGHPKLVTIVHCPQCGRGTVPPEGLLMLDMSLRLGEGTGFAAALLSLAAIERADTEAELGLEILKQIREGIRYMREAHETALRQAKAGLN